MKIEIKHADIGDYLKVFACTAVMLQPTIALVLATHPQPHTQMILGILYNLVKYTAPAFIFGILYTTTRTHLTATWADYPTYMKGTWHGLFIPSIWWTTIYLVVMPWVQQVNHYHDVGSFLWHFVNGNAAPHLWYNTMMLQFIILMPFFWLLARFVDSNPRRGWSVALITLIGYLLWLVAYSRLLAHGWYLLDRLFVSFVIYGIFGVLAVKFAPAVNHYLKRLWPVSLLVLIGAFAWTNWELRSFGFPVSLANAPYYKPSMTLYALAVIACVAALCLYNTLRNNERTLRVFHYLANYAYKAYLSNIFWLQIVWHLSDRGTLHQTHPLVTLLLCWVSTWILSFMSAVGINTLWTKVKSLRTLAPAN